MDVLDTRDVEGKPLRLKLKSGQVLIGMVQVAALLPEREGLIPFLTIEKRRELRNRFATSGSDKTFASLTRDQVSEFFEYIPLAQVESYEVIETEVQGMRLVTQNDKEIQIHDFQVQVIVLDTPGIVKITIKIPGHDKIFDVGERAIKDGLIEVPVSVAFVSYATEDKKEVADISRRLNEFAVVTWFDKRNLMAGDDWEMRIEQAIEKADYFLLFLSRRTTEKIGFKNRELHLALKQQSYRPRGKIFIIPILLDDCAIPHDLRRLNCLKVTDEDWFENLVGTIAPWYAKNQHSQEANQIIAGHTTPRQTDTVDEGFKELATMSPRQAIAEKWNELVKAILDAGARIRMPMTRVEEKDPSLVINTLLSKRLLNESDKEEFFSLKKWYFNISFSGIGHQVEPLDAMTFATLANQLITKLTTI